MTLRDVARNVTLRDVARIVTLRDVARIVTLYLLDVAPLNAVYDLFFCPVDVVRVVVDVELGNYGL